MPARRLLSLALSPSLILILLACGGPGAGGPGTEIGPPAPRTWTGVVRYEARSPTSLGTSEATEERPARWLDLELRDAAGQVLAQGQLDGEGRFSIEGPSDAAELSVLTHIAVRGHDVAITNDRNGRDIYRFNVPLAPHAQATDPIEIVARDGGQDQFSGAFHMIDTMLRGLDTATEWSGRQLPPVFAYWMRGGTREWSYYRGERPPESGRYGLELLGGDPGQRSISDTDEHDEDIILHELGHFVMDRLSTDSSTGGTHPGGYNLDPGLAWEEGRATWFAAAVQGQPFYRDTIGMQPWGSLRVDQNIETGDTPPRSMGSESSVERVLWDLTDGPAGWPDEDHDGVALGPQVILRAMMELGEVEGAYPCLSTFLRHLVTRGHVQEADVRAMLQRVGEPAELLPSDDTSVWPIDVASGQTVTGLIDGLSQPAPSGGPNRPDTGFDASRAYRVRVARGGFLHAHLRILDGSGSMADRTDLDIEIRDIRGTPMATSQGEVPQEIASKLVTPGTYIIYIRDGGRGNRARFELRVEVETLGG